MPERLPSMPQEQLLQIGFVACLAVAVLSCLAATPGINDILWKTTPLIDGETIPWNELFLLV